MYFGGHVILTGIFLYTGMNTLDAGQMVLFTFFGQKDYTGATRLANLCHFEVIVRGYGLGYTIAFVKYHEAHCFKMCLEF
jgi:hypothetical protein